MMFQDGLYLGDNFGPVLVYQAFPFDAWLKILIFVTVASFKSFCSPPISSLFIFFFLFSMVCTHLLSSSIMYISNPSSSSIVEFYNPLPSAITAMGVRTLRIWIVGGLSTWLQAIACSPFKIGTPCCAIWTWYVISRDNSWSHYQGPDISVARYISPGADWAFFSCYE